MMKKVYRNVKDIGNRAEWKEGSIEQELYNKVIGMGFEFKRHGEVFVCAEAGIMYHEK